MKEQEDSAEATVKQPHPQIWGPLTQILKMEIMFRFLFCTKDLRKPEMFCKFCLLSDFVKGHIIYAVIVNPETNVYA